MLVPSPIFLPVLYLLVSHRRPLERLAKLRLHLLVLPSPRAVRPRQAILHLVPRLLLGR